MESRRYGTSPILAVTVHGGPGAPGSVSSLARSLSRIVGTLEPFQSAMSINELVKELARQINSESDPPVYLLGHSWGAWLVYLTVYRYPELVRKVFLIGSGAFDSRYLPVLNTRRRQNLNEEERQEYDRLPELIETARVDEKTRYLDRLGALAKRADCYCVEAVEENQDEVFSLNASQYQSIWTEASRMREEGFLLRIAQEISVPIRVIHGTNDPTPIEGVVDPLKDKIADLRWYELTKCGHEPWKEKYARSEFWRIITEELEQ